jgi:iron(III) transport system ATP-binding protein
VTIRVHDVTKRFDDAVALDSFTLDVWEGDLLSLLGPSGCGKTTALRVIAGFEHPDAGEVEIAGRDVVGPGTFVSPEARRVGMVFQDYALFPHMTVARNVAYGLGRNDERERRMAEVLDLVGLAHLVDRLPHELSGGQQQRVALARALAPRPEVVLLDEPFSNLDAGLRERVRREVRAILQEAGTTAVFVTHDQEEALAMSDTVAVMRHGTIVQAAAPDELYLRPVDPWIARFLGDAGFVAGVAVSGRVETQVGTFETELDGPVEVMIRPEDVSFDLDPAGIATVIDREFFGHDQLVTLQFADGQQLRSRAGPTRGLRRDQRVNVRVEKAVTFPAG